MDLGGREKVLGGVAGGETVLGTHCEREKLIFNEKLYSCIIPYILGSKTQCFYI